MEDLPYRRLHQFIPAILLVFSVLLGLLYLHRGFSFLLSGGKLPVDLALRWWELRYLLEGQNIYQTLAHLPYPPGALFLLYPLIGWISYEWVAPAWAFWNGAALLVLAYISYDFLKIHIQGLWLFAAVASVFVFQSIGQGLAIGQITIIYMATFSVFLWMLLKKEKMSLLEKYGIMPLLLAFFAGKFTIFLPVCFYLLLHKKYRLLILTGAAWHALAFAIASVLTQVRLPDLIIDWLQVKESFENLGSIDLSFFLSLIGIGTPWNILLALAGMILLSWWLYQRQTDVFSAIVILMIYGRFWMYHNHYDNIMLWPLLIWLWIWIAPYIQKEISQFEVWKPGVLFLFLCTAAFPARFLYWDAPYYGVLLILQMITWVGVVFLVCKTSVKYTQKLEEIAK